MSDIKAITDYLRKYNACRRGEDERTMDEAGIVPADLGQMIDAAVGSLERFPAMSRIALRKIEQMGGTPCGLLVRNEAGALAAVSDMGRVTWLDDYIMAPVARDEDVALPKQAARAQGDAEPVVGAMADVLGEWVRRRLFKNEIGVDVSNAEHMALLAEMLEIQADGGESNFVAYTLRCFERELRARFHERRALELRQQEDSGDE